MNSQKDRLLSTETIFDVGPVHIPDVTKVTITSMRLRQTATGLMVISYIAPRAVVWKPLACDTLSALWHNISPKGEGVSSSSPQAGRSGSSCICIIARCLVSVQCLVPTSTRPHPFFIHQHTPEGRGIDPSHQHYDTSINKHRCRLCSPGKLSGEVLAWLSVWSEVQMICIWSS